MGMWLKLEIKSIRIKVKNVSKKANCHLIITVSLYMQMTDIW